MITRLRSAGIWISEAHILLESLADRELWGIPGGFVEDGESVEQACAREYFEETGLKVECARLAIIHEQFWVDHGQPVREYGFYFIIKPAEEVGPCPTIMSLEGHLQFRWQKLTNLRKIDFVPLTLKGVMSDIPDGTIFISTKEDLPGKPA